MPGTAYLEIDGDVAFLVIDNPPVNAGSGSVRTALLSLIEQVDADPSIKAAVLIGAGQTFMAGSDIKEFDLPLTPPQLPQVIGAIERSPTPFVAAISGAALGGGYEFALACDARIATPEAAIGLPETQLGILPGAGGTQKLPRLVGLAKAVELIAGGKRIGAAEALALGMIDQLAGSDLRAEAAALARGLVGSKRRVIDRPVPPYGEEALAGAIKAASSGGRARPHVLEAIACIKATTQLSAAEGLAKERAAFERLRVGAEAKALRHVFFAERDAMRGREDRNARPGPVERVGVVGAGTMGAGIATAMLQAGLSTVLVDADVGALQRAEERITAALEKGLAAGKFDAEGFARAKAGLATGTSLAALGESDLIVEAIVEDLAVKQSVFAELDRLARPEAILASNTSYLDIDAIASATGRPDKVIGLHFFSPAHIMKLVEVVAGSASADEAMATGLALARRIGKQPVETGNGFGFVGNRIYAAYRASCEFMLEDGALPQDVDAAMVAFGFAMGPFAVSDMSGLDIAWRMRQAQASSRDQHARYVDIPDKLCEAGRYGRKTGAGYYRYDEAGRGQPDPEVEALIKERSAAKGVVRRALSAEEIQDRALAAIVNEAGLVLEEGVALRKGDIDVVLVNGYGFPRWRGGPLHWAQSQDPQVLSEACARFVAEAAGGKRRADLRALGILSK